VPSLAWGVAVNKFIRSGQACTLADKRGDDTVVLFHAYLESDNAGLALVSHSWGGWDIVSEHRLRLDGGEVFAGIRRAISQAIEL